MFAEETPPCYHCPSSPSATTHVLLDELADAVVGGTRKELQLTAAEDLLEIIMRRYERASTLFTSTRPVEDGTSC